MPTISGLKLLSVLVFGLVLIGFANRRRRRIHIPLMVTAFLIDLGMVLYIELTRHAIEKAAAGVGPLMGVHIGLSVAVLLLYLGQIVGGIMKLRGRPVPWHRWGGGLFLLARFGNLVTSFMIA